MTFSFVYLCYIESFSNSDSISSNPDETKPVPVLYFSTPIKSSLVPSEKDEPDFSTPEPVRESTVEKCSSMDIFELCETLDPTSIFFEKLEKITTISSGSETIMNADTPEIDTGDTGTMDTILDTVKEVKQSTFHWNWVLFFLTILFVMNSLIFVYFYGRFVNLQNELTQLRKAVLSNNLKNLREEKTDLVIWYNFWENLMQYLFKVYMDITRNISSLFK